MPNRPYTRAERVGDEIQKTLGEIINRNINFEDVDGLITISKVIMTSDLKMAKIYLSYLGNEETRSLAFKLVHNHKIQIRQLLGQNIHLKTTPLLKFYNDNTFEQISKIEQLLQKIDNESDSD